MATRLAGAPYQAAGPTQAPAVVLIHGSVVTGAMWAPQVRALAGDHRVIVPDLPGHGGLAHVPFSFDAAAAAIESALRAEAPRGAVVAGLSLGGYVAMTVAARVPDAVRGLVLSGCSVNFTGLLGGWVRLVGAAMRRGWLRQSPATAERRVRAIFPPGFAADADAQVRAGVFPEALGPAFAALAGRDFRPVLAAYPGPVLILNGERDRPARRGEAAFAAAARRARVQTIAGAGHACSLDQAAAYTAMLRAFVAEAGR